MTNTIEKVYHNGTEYVIKDTTYSAWTGIDITWTTISNDGVTSFNGSTWAVTYTAPVISVNSNTWAVTVTEFSPSNAWTTGDVLQKTAWWYEWWAAPATWIQNDTTWTTTTVTAIRAWTEAEYNALQTHSADIIYHIY